MGLIVFLTAPMYRAINVSVLQPEDFMLRPILWMKALSEFQGRITCAPTSAYALCARFLKDSDIEQFDLRNLRATLVGAEMISQKSLQQFAAKLQPAGFSVTSLLPAYGLAENGVAVTLMPVNVIPQFHSINLHKIHSKGSPPPSQLINA